MNNPQQSQQLETQLKDIARVIGVDVDKYTTVTQLTDLFLGSERSASAQYAKAAADLAKLGTRYLPPGDDRIISLYCLASLVFDAIGSDNSKAACLQQALQITKNESRRQNLSLTLASHYLQSENYAKARDTLGQINISPESYLNAKNNSEILLFYCCKALLERLEGNRVESANNLFNLFQVVERLPASQALNTSKTLVHIYHNLKTVGMVKDLPVVARKAVQLFELAVESNQKTEFKEAVYRVQLDALKTNGLYKEALDVQEVLLAAYDQETDLNSSKAGVWSAQSERSGLLDEAGKPDEAFNMLRHAVATARAKLEPNNPELIALETKLCAEAYVRADKESGNELFAKIESSINSKITEELQAILSGEIVIDKAVVTKALESAGDELAEYFKSVACNYLYVAGLKSIMSVENPELGISFFERSLDIIEIAMPDYVVTKFNLQAQLADFLIKVGESDRAQVLADDCLSNFKEVSADQHFTNHAVALRLQGKLAHAHYDLSNATDFFEASLEKFKKIPSKVNSIHLVHTQVDFSEMLISSSDYQSALTHLLDAEQILRKRGREESPFMIYTAKLIIDCLEQLGETDQIEKYQDVMSKAQVSLFWGDDLGGFDSGAFE